MANGIDWFRWHHGSVNDPKFGLVAKKAGARVGDVIAVWALVLELASANQDRGQVDEIDHETTDFLLGAEDGTTARILSAMEGRGLLTDGRVARWDARQPKREREDNTAAERKRQQRAREATESQSEQCHVASHQVTPRGEKSREEKKEPNDNTVVVVPAEPDNPRAAALPPREDPPESTDPAIVLAVALRKLGVDATFTHPAVQDWTTRKIPMEMLNAAVALAREQKGPAAKIAPNYLVPIVEKLLNPPAASAPAFGKPAQPIPIRKPQGMDPKGTDESYEEYDARITAAESARRKGANP